MISTVDGRPPRSLSADERYLIEDRLWRRQIIRRGLIAALVIGVTTSLFVLARPIANHLLAAWWLERLGCRVHWQSDETNWRQGGVTSVSGVRPWGSAFQVFGADLGDRDLHYLLDLRPVQSLNLEESDRITDNGLAILGGLKHLTELDLARLNRFRDPGNNSVPLTEACLVHLQALPRLQKLSISGNRITDRGLAQVAQLKNLAELDLVATEVTDAGLVHLQGMKSLRSVNLAATRATAEGIAKLQQARPDLTISLEIDPRIARGVKLRRGEAR
jgi:hypothetical protein